MRIGRIRLKNWLCYRGEQEIELGPLAYAVVARRVDDADRSNWLGKSSLLEAIDFGLYGRHRHRLEDDWISKGEKSGSVSLEIVEQGGTKMHLITRSRDRGKSTKLEYWYGDAPAAMKDEAQGSIERMMGYSAEDFRATCYFEQKQMARFITDRPEDRMATVSSWFRLAPLESAEDAAGERISILSKKVSELEGYARGVQQALDERPEQESSIVQDLKDALERARGKLALLQDAMQKNAAVVLAKSRADEYQGIVQEGTKLKKEFDALSPEERKKAFEKANADLQEVMVSRSEMHRRMSDLERLKRGQFDGACPVAQGFTCPAKIEINSRSQQNEEAYQKAKVASQAVEAKFSALNGQVTVERNLLEDVRLLEVRLETLRERGKRLIAEGANKKVSDSQDSSKLREEVGIAQDNLQEFVRRLAVAERSVAERAGFLNQQEDIGNKLAIAREELGVLRESRVIFQGAKKRVAEGALAEIESVANEAFIDCSVDLRVRVSWAREGQGLARKCEACGDPFPTSARVKSCARCGAPRGANVVNKLELELSDRSGAADDLAGITTQFAASAWLRADRGSAWGTALIDEPFGALDKAHRKALGSHLATMLSSRYGFEQALVVAHSPDVLDALPGRIEIVAGQTGSTVRVIT